DVNALCVTGMVGTSRATETSAQTQAERMHPSSLPRLNLARFLHQLVLLSNSGLSAITHRAAQSQVRRCI
ncbi:MAG: hypothetical protein ACPIOQ_47045, partial [Promethearchaeia archaeon]